MYISRLKSALLVVEESFIAWAIHTNKDMLEIFTPFSQHKYTYHVYQVAYIAIAVASIAWNIEFKLILYSCLFLVSFSL